MDAWSSAVSLAELIEKLKALPVDRQEEIFDFVEFLSSRPTDAARRGEDWVDVNYSEFALAQALRGMEEDSVAYTKDDIKERWQ
jgi:hypothetical protein